MPIVIRAVLAVVGVGVAAACTRPSPEQTATPPPRYLEDGVLVSTCRPVLRLRAHTGFRYLGAHPFRIRDVAAGERHVFADTSGSRVRRLLLLQFEGFLDRAEGSYNPERRHELIIFYIESMADAGYTLAQIGDDGGIRPPYRAVADSLTARSLRAFSILPPGGTPSCAP